MQRDKSRRLSGYVICTVARSGGNYFCQILGSTNALGYPLEYFNVAGWRRQGIPDYPERFEDQIDWILTHGATPNGVYGVKVVPYEFDEKGKFPWIEHLPNLKFIYLWRRDALAQAISLSRAIQTGRWHTFQAAQRTAHYDRLAIADCLRRTLQDDARWRLFFARNGIEPLHVIYESILDDPQQSVDAVATHMDLTAATPINWSTVTLRQQRDADRDDWRDRFIAESADISALDKYDNSSAATLLRLAQDAVRKIRGH